MSDHAPTEKEPFDDWRMNQSDLPEYYELIERARNHAGDRLPVRAGLECDWLQSCENWIEKLAESYKWDYLIGSVHYIGNKWDFDNPKWIGKWGETDVEEAWTLYWQTYSNMAKSRLFDILGHPDLIKKFGFKPAGDLRRFYEPVIAAIASSDSAIELNTAGFHKPCAEQYPSKEFLKLASSAGIPIVLSSDAHSPSEVGRNFDEGLELLHSSGYQNLAFFENRQIRTTDL